MVNPFALWGSDYVWITLFSLVQVTILKKHIHKLNIIPRQMLKVGNRFDTMSNE